MQCFNSVFADFFAALRKKSTAKAPTSPRLRRRFGNEACGKLPPTRMRHLPEEMAGSKANLARRVQSRQHLPDAPPKRRYFCSLTGKSCRQSASLSRGVPPVNPRPPRGAEGIRLLVCKVLVLREVGVSGDAVLVQPPASSASPWLREAVAAAGGLVGAGSCFGPSVRRFEQIIQQRLHLGVSLTVVGSSARNGVAERAAFKMTAERMGKNFMVRGWIGCVVSPD